MTNGIVANNLVSANSQLNNTIIQNAQIDTLTVSSLKIKQQLGKQVFNTIKFSNANTDISCTVTWEKINSLYLRNTIILTIIHDNSSLTVSGFRTEVFRIDTYSMTVSSQSHATGYGDLEAYSQLLITNVITSANSITFTSTSSLSRMLSHSMTVTIDVIPDFIGDISLS